MTNSDISQSTDKRTANLIPWKPGQSGNPGGSKKMPPDVRAMLDEVAPQALEVAAKILLSTRHSARTRLLAAQLLLDRAWGKPAQAITGDAENPLAVQLIEIVKASVSE